MNTKIHKKFGERLKFLRKDKGLTQERLAEKVNVHPTYIGKIEGGKSNPSLLMIYKIAKALDVQISEIFNFDI